MAVGVIELMTFARTAGAAALTAATLTAPAPGALAADVLATVPAGLSPQAAAVAPDGATAIVANTGGSSLSLVSLADNSVSATVPVAAAPSGAAFTPDGARAFVSSQSGAVSILDTRAGSVLRTLSLGGRPADAAVSPDGRYVVIPRREDDKVSVLSAATGNQLAEIATPRRPAAVDFSADGSRAFVANFGADSVSVIDMGSFTAIGTVAVGDAPIDVAAAPDDPNRLYVANRRAGTLSVINSGLTTATVTGLQRPGGVATSGDGRLLYVTQSGADSVAVVDAATAAVTTALPTGDGPVGIAVAGDGSRAVVANAYSRNATVMSLAPKAAARPGTVVAGTRATMAGKVAADSGPVGDIRCYFSSTMAQAAAGPHGGAASVPAVPAAVAPNSTAEVGCTADDLTVGTTYHYVVAARDPDGLGWSSAVQSFRTVPRRPRQISVVGRRRALVWRWEPQADATGYEARIRLGSRWRSWTATPRAKIKFNRLERTTRYRVQIRAANEAGKGGWRTKRARTR